MNRYIKVMKIGLDNEREGISYFDLINQLGDELSFSFGIQSKLTFLV
jgi:hypothetical protein